MTTAVTGIGRIRRTQPTTTARGTTWGVGRPQRRPRGDTLRRPPAHPDVLVLVEAPDDPAARRAHRGHALGRDRLVEVPHAFPELPGGRQPDRAPGAFAEEVELALDAGCGERVPAAGTVLTRVYKGKEYKVTVLEDGFRCDGTEYRSLSALAAALTGAKSIN